MTLDSPLTLDLHLKGTVRARDPSETLKIIQPYIQKAGITRLANLTHLDCLGIPVFTCIRPLSKNLSTSQGKGITDDLAKCSAYMEAIEHFFSENIQADLISPMDQIPESSRVDLDLLSKGLIHSDQVNPYQTYITHWTLCESLLGEKSLYFPTEYFSFNLTQPCLENSLFKKTTTGLASGNNLIEASVHALYECVERHMSFLFSKLSHAEKMARILNPDSINYPEAQDLIKKLKNHHIDCVIFDTTQNLNIPTFHVIIADDNPFRKLGHYSGTGTHLHAGIALCRALTEAVQSRLTYIAGSRDDMFPKDYKTQWGALKFSGTYLFKLDPEKTYLSLQEQYDFLLNTLKNHAFHPYRHIHTQASDLITVLKIMIPGMAL